MLQTDKKLLQTLTDTEEIHVWTDTDKLHVSGTCFTIRHTNIHAHVHTFAGVTSLQSLRDFGLKDGGKLLVIGASGVWDATVPCVRVYVVCACLCCVYACVCVCFTIWSMHPYIHAPIHTCILCTHLSIQEFAVRLCAVEKNLCKISHTCMHAHAIQHNINTCTHKKHNMNAHIKKTGGCGQTGVQIGKALGASVTGVCSGKNADLVKK